MIDYFKKYKNVFFAFFILTFLLYGNSLKNKYALDDDYITVTNFPEKGKEYVPNNQLVAKGFKGIKRIWKSRYAHDSEGSFDYRPVTSTSFAIEYGIFGQNPFINHFINILIYALTVWVLFCVLLKLLETYENKFLIALLTSVIFLILPIHTEAVDNIKSRDELLAFLFPLFSLWYCLKAYDKFSLKNLLFIFLFFVLGFYSKRSAMIFLGIIPVCLILFRKVNFKKFYIPLILLISVAFTNSLIKKQLLSENLLRKFYHFENPIFTEHFSFFDKITAALKTLGFYIKFSIIPYPFRNYYGTNVVDISGGFDVYLFIALLFLISGTLFFYKTRNKLFLFGYLLFLGGIFPFLNFLSPVAGVIGERLAYNASFGFSVMLASLMLPLFKTNDKLVFNDLLKKPLIYFMPVIVIFILLIWNRNTDWKNKLVLFEKDIPHLEKSAKANSLLANEYFEILRTGNNQYSNSLLVKKALDHYTLAIKNDSTFYTAYNNAGVIYYSYMSNLKEAKRYFKLAVKFRPSYPQAFENIGNCFKEEHQIDSAFQYYKKAIELNPKQYTAYIACVKMLYENKQYQKSIDVNKLALLNFPGDYKLIGQEADCLFMLGNIKEALSKYSEAYNIYPSHELAQYLSAKYLELRDTANYNIYKNL